MKVLDRALIALRICKLGVQFAPGALRFTAHFVSSINIFEAPRWPRPSDSRHGVGVSRRRQHAGLDRDTLLAIVALPTPRAQRPANTIRAIHCRPSRANGFQVREGHGGVMQVSASD